MFTMSRSGIVNVRMVITEEKILSNIDKVKKLINPNSKKQIIQLEEDAYFKDLIESIKTYLIEYPKKKNFPKGVYKAAYQLVEYTTSEFEENTRKIEELIRQRETNISLAAKLKKTLNMIVNKEENWKQALKEISNDFSEDIVDTLSLIGRAKSKKSQNCQDCCRTNYGASPASVSYFQHTPFNIHAHYAWFYIIYVFYLWYSDFLQHKSSPFPPSL